MSFDVLVPNEPPETGYSSVGNFSSYEEAESEARDRAEQGGPRSTVLIESTDENDSDVWSVSYRPDPPVFLGLTPDGVANVEWPVEFRVVHDPTRVEQVFDNDTGDELERTVVGQVQVIAEEISDVVRERQEAAAAQSRSIG